MPLLHTAPGATAIVDARRVIYFVGTAYHAMQSHPAVLGAAAEALNRLGMGSATSRGRFGTTSALLALEKSAARFYGMPEAFHLPSGYLAAGALARVVGGNYDKAACDEHSHYALKDAAAVAGLGVETFSHRNPKSLDRLLGKFPRSLVMTDGVFAMSGAVAPLDEYAKVLDNYPDSALLVDDAHGVGVLGENGRGTYEHCGLWAASINASPKSKMLLCATLSKAMGGYGGIIPAGKGMLKAIEECPLYNGASPAPPAVTAGSAAALQILCGDKKPIVKLRENAALARKLLKEREFKIEDFPTPIIWLEIGDAEKMKDIQEKVWEQGVAIDYVPAYSGVSENGGIRIAVCSAHTNEQIEQLASAMARAV